MRFLIWLVVNALALWAATLLVDGIDLGPGTQTERAIELVVVGAIFGVITAFIRPIVRFVSLPLIIVTLGLMLLVINALMLMLTGVIADALGLAFTVDGFWPALWGSIVISICLLVLETIIPSSKD